MTPKKKRRKKKMKIMKKIDIPADSNKENMPLQPEAYFYYNVV